MPFTLSHPAAVAPFWRLVRRNYLPLCALVIGTLSPDFEYLWRLRTEWHWSHTPLGVLDFCLPVGLVTVAVWVFVLRAPTRQLLALPAAPLELAPRWWLAASVAIVIGAFTHIVWDGFTHGSDWAVRWIPGLQHRVRLDGVSIPVFNLLQHASTLIGGMIVLTWIVREVRRGEPSKLLIRWRIAVSGFLVAVAGLLATWNASRAGRVSGYWARQVWLSRAGVGALLGLGIGLIAYAGVYHLVTAAPRA